MKRIFDTLTAVIIVAVALYFGVRTAHGQVQAGTVTVVTEIDSTVTPIIVPAVDPPTTDTLWIIRTVTTTIRPSAYDTTISVTVDTLFNTPPDIPSVPSGSTDIGAAIDSASALTAQGIDATVLLSAGSYAVPLVVNHSGTGRLTIDGKGAAVFTGYAQVEDATCTNDQWIIPWPDAYPVECPNDSCDPSGGRTSTNGLRRDLLRVDGVLSTWGTQPGQHTRDDASVFVSAPCTATIEASTATHGVELRGPNVTLTGVTVEGVATKPEEEGAALYLHAAHDAVVDDVVVADNNWNGIEIQQTNGVTITSSTLERNGHDGLTAHMVASLVVVDNSVSFNGWRACEAGGLIGWSIGNKILRTIDMRIGGNTFDSNCARNLWIDYANEDFVVHDNVFASSANIDGLWVEANRRGEVRDNHFVNNFRAGLSITFTNDLQIVGNTFQSNGRSLSNMHSRDCTGAGAPTGTDCIGRTVGWRDWELFKATGQNADIDVTHDNNWQRWTITGNASTALAGAQLVWWGSVTNELMQQVLPSHLSNSTYANNANCIPGDNGMGFQSLGHFKSVAWFNQQVNDTTSGPNCSGAPGIPPPPSAAPVPFVDSPSNWESKPPPSAQ